MKYRVSIIIPVFNCEKHLKRAIESVVSGKGFSQDELILVDDGSTDGSGSICDSFCNSYPNIKTIHQNNSGVSAARNSGMIAAEGEWIFFLDSDDYIFENAINDLLQYSDADLVSGRFTSNCYSALMKPPFMEGVYSIDSVKQILNDTLIKEKSFFNCWGRLYRKKLIDDNGLTFPVDIRIAEDMVFVYSYLKLCNTIAFTDRQVYFYYVNEDNTTSVIPESFDVDYYVFKWHCSFFKENQLYLKELKAVFASRAFDSIKTAAYYLSFSKALPYVKRILDNSDFNICYKNSDIVCFTKTDKAIDKFIRKHNPYMVCLIIIFSKFKTIFYNMIFGDKND